jgi:hypothetical protein
MSLEYHGLVMKSDGVASSIDLTGGTMGSVEPSKDAVESWFGEISEMGRPMCMSERVGLPDETCTLVLTAERTADKAKVEISRWDTIEEVNTFSEHNGSLAFEAGYMAVPTKWSCDRGWAVVEKQTSLYFDWTAGSALPTFHAHFDCWRSTENTWAYGCDQFLRSVGVLLDQAKLGNPLIETEESQWYDDKDGSDTDSD